MDKNKRMLEVCVDSVESALIAQVAGAQRVEFCQDLPEGGITPSHAQISRMCKELKIKINVLIRPRGGDFLYSNRECQIMAEDIIFCGENHCHGVVIGLLNADGSVDKSRTAPLISLAHDWGMSVTFHRAIDRSCDLLSALEDIIALGCDRVLTSGGYNHAIEGKEVIKALIERAGERIVVMPGAGITPENAGDLLHFTHARELHGTFREKVPGKMLYRNPHLNSPDEYDLWLASAAKIQEVVSILAQN
jgi:copper homeostasis protein